MSNKFFKLAHFAFRNLFRNKRRTLFTLLIAAASFCAMAIAAGYYAYSVFGIQELTIRNGFSGSGGTGHLQVTDQRRINLHEEYALEFGIEDYQELSDKITENVHVDYVLPRIELGGLISNGDKSIPFIGYGVKPELEIKLLEGLVSVNPVLDKGNDILQLKSMDFGVVLGKKLAQALNAEVGDTLMLFGTTVDGGVNAIDVALTNIISTGINEVDKYYLLTNIKTAQVLVNTERVSLLAVMLNDRKKIDQSLQPIAKDIEGFQGQEFAIQDWVELGEYYQAVRDLFVIIFTFMGSIIIVIAILSCWNITNMATMERIREIGTLQAIGLKNRYITLVFIIEGFFISVLGVIVGYLMQLVMVSVINNLLIPMPPIPGMNQGYFLQVYQYTENHITLALSVIFAITFSGLSSFFTIRKLSIIESLDHV